MGLDNVPRCRHVRVNGTQCGSPALRRSRFCYFHLRAQVQRMRISQDQFKHAQFILPVLEDANAVQLALMQVMQLLASGQMDHKTAGLMLYGLQTASCNLRSAKFEVEPTDVIIDRGTVGETCINGPQWFAQDFPDEPEAVEEKSAAENRENGGATEPCEKRLRAGRGKMRKRPHRAAEEIPSWLPESLHAVFPKMMEDAARARLGAG